MSSRGRSTSPHPLNDEDVEMDNVIRQATPDAKVVIVTNLTRNVVEAHLRTVFGFYGDITKIDLPKFGKSGQNRGKAALEYSSVSGAHQAASHMDGGQLDGAILKVELSDLPVRSRSRSRVRNPNTARSLSRLRSSSRGAPARRRPAYDREPRYGDSYRGKSFGRRGHPSEDHQEVKVPKSFSVFKSVSQSVILPFPIPLSNSVTFIFILLKIFAQQEQKQKRLAQQGTEESQQG
ncbi:hypothetical protein M0805_007480 [Coniferiporia weirii]|nr:hypothetical protein M0805_007480 [Coniferiporia weirii]